MAVMKIWQIKGRADHAIDYAKNEEKTRNPNYQKEDDLQAVLRYASNADKTEKQFFVSGVNCNVSTAYEQFQTVKMQYGKEGGIVAYHAYQSFAEGEVTPEIAHQIGMEFAKKVWGTDYQVIVATHLNTKCLHNHFVVNSVSYKHGRRCRAKQWRELSRISDEICKKYELNVIEQPLGKSIPYALAIAEREGKPTRLNMAKEAVDMAISQSCNMREFSLVLKEMGYTLQYQYNRKYWTIRQKDWKKPIRLARLGEDYTNDRIEERVLENPSEVRLMRLQKAEYKNEKYNLPTREHKIKKVGGLKGLYLHYCYKLGYLPKYNQSPVKVHYIYRDDLLKMKQIAEEAKLLMRENISTMDELKGYEEKLTGRLEEKLTERRKIYNQSNQKFLTSEEKDVNTRKLMEINSMVSEIREELKLCKGVEKRSVSIEEKMEREHKEQILQRGKEKQLR